MRRAVITGMGPVSALGEGLTVFWTALLEGKSGLRALSRCAPGRMGCAASAEVTYVPPPELEGMSPMPRAVQLALRAAEQAWTAAAWPGDTSRVGIVVGTGLGNLDLVESELAAMDRRTVVSPVIAFRAFANAAACEIASLLDLRGPIQTVSTGCNSGADALGVALGWIRLGLADIVLAGGTEAELTPGFLRAMQGARALAVRHNNSPESASRPFDTSREGNVPGEGAAFMVLEDEGHARRRGARIHGQIAGHAALAAGRRPPYDPFSPVFDTGPLARTIRAAIADAGLVTIDVGAVSANGSSSVFYDPLEAAAIAEVFHSGDRRIPVFSIKGGLGQTGAVSPVLQTIAATLAIEHGVIPPTVHADTIDPRCDLDLVRGAPRERALSAVVCNAIGFGGYYNAAWVVRRHAIDLDPHEGVSA